MNDLAGVCEDGSAEHGDPEPGFDLPATELSPSLLAIEAERRGIHLKDGSAEELRREIYQELAQNRPHAGADDVR